MDGNLPEPHRAVQNLWNAQLQPLNPVPLLFTLQLSGLWLFQHGPAAGKHLVLVSSCLTGELGVGCAVHQLPHHNTRMWWMGALQSQEGAYPAPEAPPEA